MSTKVCKIKDGIGCGKDLPLNKFDKYGDKYYQQCIDCRGEKKMKHDAKAMVAELYNADLSGRIDSLEEEIYDLKTVLEDNTKAIILLTSKFERILDRKNRHVERENAQEHPEMIPPEVVQSQRSPIRQPIKPNISIQSRIQPK